MSVNFVGSAMVVFAVIGSTLLAINTDFSKFGYIFFLISSSFGVIEGKKLKSNSLLLMSAYFTIINATGVYRWILSGL